MKTCCCNIVTTNSTTMCLHFHMKNTQQNKKFKQKKKKNKNKKWQTNFIKRRNNSLFSFCFYTFLLVYICMYVCTRMCVCNTSWRKNFMFFPSSFSRKIESIQMNVGMYILYPDANTYAFIPSYQWLSKNNKNAMQTL